jgi:hypothetical protein
LDHKNFLSILPIVYFTDFSEIEMTSCLQLHPRGLDLGERKEYGSNPKKDGNTRADYLPGGNFVIPLDLIDFCLNFCLDSDRFCLNFSPDFGHFCLDFGIYGKRLKTNRW